MIQFVLSILRRVPASLRNVVIPYGFRKSLKRFIRASEIKAWTARGRPAPPPHAVKVDAVLAYRERYDLTVLVETGTYMGDMIEAVIDHFEWIYSIELDTGLFDSAKRRFSGSPRVKLIHGDSGSQINTLLTEVEVPILFWLDAHHSGEGTARGSKDSPILEEVRSILDIRAGRDVILIDDARRFCGSGGFPELSEFAAFIRSRPGVEMSVADDMIRICPVGVPESEN